MYVGSACAYSCTKAAIDLFSPTSGPCKSVSRRDMEVERTIAPRLEAGTGQKLVEETPSLPYCGPTCFRWASGGEYMDSIYAAIFV